MTRIDQEAIWSQRYRDVGEDYLFGVAPCRFLEVHRHVLDTGATALSVADGEGRNSVWLAEQGLAVTAMEISPVALEKARRLARGRGVEVNFMLADIMADAWPSDVYDFVVAVFIQFVGPGEREIQFARMKQAVKPGGLLLLHGYTPKQIEYKTGGPSAIENLYTEDLLRRSFADFEIETLHAYEADVDEGKGHRGRSALIDLIARKPTTY
ncbi:MAG: class I SAM-dependent methyltransferase [Gammaproteobacteria bacterium]|nr:class I SAM-dependent methyltransferase [Gammaproteobacteria bacterium]MBU1414481.1 class I SAM-dependent methyltransferase [Gammaproteobacteria bacterium]